jgi:hypothetical protein
MGDHETADERVVALENRVESLECQVRSLLDRLQAAAALVSAPVGPTP